MDNGPVIDDVGIQRSALELLQACNKYRVRVGENREEWSAGVAEVVDNEELAPRL